MTPDEQRIAIAEACGWRRFKSPIGEVILANPGPEKEAFWRAAGAVTCNEPLTALPTADTLMPWKSVPDYLNDLNAMYEAEQLIVGDIGKCLSYQKAILKSYDSKGYTLATSFIWHATAAQRAEAFLRTVGKWKESE